ncbi:hypothetical protein EDB19DRAFT_1027534 [Suillus lakei]|nr:hypothetical protein EDB19DRAFT_1027534 [Suillus lakei]
MITTAQQTARRLVRQRPFELVRPPKQLYINPYIGRPYVQFYGYAVPHDWLVRFAEKECPEMLPERDDRLYEHDAAVRAYELISAQYGFQLQEFRFCFNPKDGSVPPLWFEAFTAKYFRNGDDEIRATRIDEALVLVLCSELDDSFKERPTQGQVDVMTELVGQPPQWWVGCGVSDYD